jgi:hypothetical protein
VDLHAGDARGGASGAGGQLNRGRIGLAKRDGKEIFEAVSVSQSLPVTDEGFTESGTVGWRLVMLVDKVVIGEGSHSFNATIKEPSEGSPRSAEGTCSASEPTLLRRHRSGAFGLVCKGKCGKRAERIL